ncbi:DUF2125 domain-containing protein [Microvirga sp. W0021]|uniref:DUF2125 domain-containing protein n=1 Tax=Hohaiivirga grylli TaxID=3133970 RepID=A0ABV0BMU0_9HYPH
MQVQPVKRKASKFWLYGPTALLIILVAGWCGGWFYMRGKVEEATQNFLTVEAMRGRVWDCPNRTIGGFPFRFEVSCESFAYTAGNTRVTLGPTKVVTQVYNPRHMIVEATGPMEFTDGNVSGTGNWKSLEASISGLNKGGFERIALVAEQSNVRISGLPEVATVEASSNNSEIHIRLAPDNNPVMQSFDVAINVSGAVIPLMNARMGDDAPLDVDALATFVNFPKLRGGEPANVILEMWRVVGGSVKLQKLDTRKGLRILNVQAELGLDEEHRLKGSVDIAQANYSDLMARLTSGNQEPRPLQPLPADAAKTAVVALPKVVLTNGRIRIGGMFDVPKVRLAPLY